MRAEFLSCRNRHSSIVYITQTMVRFRIQTTTLKKKKNDDTLPLLSTLLKQRRFDEMYEILQFHSHLPQWLGIGQESSVTTASILHQFIRNNAPVHLIDLLLIKLTELFRGECPASMTNAEGHTALHIAVMCGRDLDIIRRLTAQSTLPASTMDSSRRFPLHWACAATASASSRDESRRTAAVVRYLLELYPEAMMVKDATGQTPLDLSAHQSSNGRRQRTVSATLIQLDLHTALWKLLPSCRSVVRKGSKGRKHPRMRFVV